MAANVQIGGSGTLFVGEDKDIILELLDTSGVPVNMAGWAMVFDVRRLDVSPAPAIFSKTPTIAGAYNIVRATNAQRATAHLTSADMDTVKKGTYRYSWKRLDSGAETVVEYGPFVVEKATAP